MIALRLAGVVSILVPLATAQSRLFVGEQYAAGSGAFRLADVDANGTLDVVGFNGEITRGDGQGGFLPPLLWPANIPGWATGYVVTDVSGDGIADIVLSLGSDPPFVSASVVVRISDGLGGFASTTSQPVNDLNNGVAVGDLNLDGFPDIVIPARAAGTFEVLLGTGAGAFASGVPHPLPVPATQIVIGEVTGDGIPDLVMRADNPGQIVVMAGNGTGGFSVLTTIGIPSAPNFSGGVQLEDVVEDGKLDLVLTYGLSSIEVRAGDGLGGFGAPVTSATGSFSTLLEFGDLDLDGHLDLLLGRYDTGSLSVMRGDGAGAFSTAVVYRAAGTLSFPALGDLDGDGDLDCVALTGSSRITPVFGDGRGGFLDGAPAEQPLSSSARFSVARDFDNDGITDIVACLGQASVVLMRGNGTGGFGAPAQVYLGTIVAAIAAADMNQDGAQDLIVALSNTGGASAPGLLVSLRGDGAGGFALIYTTPVGGLPGSLVPADVDLDGKIDVVVAASGTSTMWIVKGDGAVGFGAVTSFGVPPYTQWSPLSVDVGDFDANGWPDLVVASGYSGLYVYPGVGAGAFGPVVTLSSAFYHGAAQLVDSDGDGFLDIATAMGPNNAVLIHKGNGLGSFAAPVTVPMGGPATRFTIADVDADGIRDVCAGIGYQPSVSVALGIGAGQFAAPRTFGVGAYPELMLIDVDADGLQDIVTANATGPANPTGSLSVLRNQSREPDAPRHLCFGDGSGTACPCGNFGGPARGCGNSVVATGARLIGSGAARISADTFVLACTDYPLGPGIYLRGSLSAAGGLGVPFGDGLLCVGGALVRLALAWPDPSSPTVGSSSLPSFPSNPTPISIQGFASAGSTLTYQFFYRNSNPSFCTSATFNLSNAVEATWVP